MQHSLHTENSQTNIYTNTLETKTKTSLQSENSQNNFQHDIYHQQTEIGEEQKPKIYLSNSSRLEAKTPNQKTNILHDEEDKDNLPVNQQANFETLWLPKQRREVEMGQCG